MNSNRCKTWCYTIFDVEEFTPELEHPVDFRQHQMEMGETSRWHLQGVVQFTTRIRLSALKKKFGDKIHWEPTVDLKASIHYVSKPVDGCDCEHCVKAVGFEPPKNKSVFGIPNVDQGKRNDVYALKRRLDSGATEEEIMDEFPMAFDKFPKLLQKHKWVHLNKKARIEYVEPRWNPWQERLFKELETVPSDRKIIWIWDKRGKIGKSQFTKHMKVVKGAEVFNGGKHADMQHLYQGGGTVIFDFSRCRLDFTPFEFLEQLKNGMFNSGKYEGQIKHFPTPHVVCFANEPPVLEKDGKLTLSEDRWDVREIKRNLNNMY